MHVYACTCKPRKIKNWAGSCLRSQPFLVTLQRLNKHHYQNMGKGTHFLGQPILNQLLNYFNKQKILQISRESGGERYVKTFNAWCHLTVMLYAVIMRFDSLREITSATMMEWRKLAHLGIKMLMPGARTRSSARFIRGSTRRTRTNFHRTAPPARYPSG